MRENFRQFFKTDIRLYGLRYAFTTLVWNVRFTAGYWVGGFTSVRRDK